MESSSIVNTGRDNLYRFFQQDAYDLNCPLEFTPSLIDIGAEDGALYTLFRDRTDQFENFANMVLKGPDLDVAYPFHAFYLDGSHWMESPTDAPSGTDFYHLVQVGENANSDEQAYGIGFHFLADSFPNAGTIKWLFFTGTRSDHIGVFLDAQALIHYIRRDRGGTTYSSVQQAVVGPINAGEWYSVYIKHDQSGRTPSGMYVNGHFTSLSAPYGEYLPLNLGALLKVKSYAPAVTNKDPMGTTPGAFVLGCGPAFSTQLAPPTFSTVLAGPGWFYSNTNLTVENDINYNYQSQAVTSAFPATGKNYYWEVNFDSGQYAWMGVCDSRADFTKSPAVIGWVMGMHNGRRWWRQTGGGVNWRDPIPPGSRIGFGYNGTTQKLSIYYDGGLWGTMETVISPESGKLLALIGADGGGKFTLCASPSSWRYSAPLNYLPLPTVEGSKDDGVSLSPLFRGRMRMFRIRKSLPSDYEIQVLGYNMVAPHIYCKNREGNTYNLDGRVYKWYDNQGDDRTEAPGYIGIKTPIVPRGFYTFYAEHRGVTKIIKRCNIKPFEPLLNTGPQYDDFTNISNTKRLWDVAHKSWGGANGGCAGQLIKITKGVAHCLAHGDMYDGPDIFGVGRRGEPVNRKTRVGSCLVSRHYYTPGIFEFRCKYPPLPGACSAIWTFHYEEAYPGDNLWNEFITDNLHKAGTPELGHWIVRNHEIDIETPSASKADPNQENATYDYGRFNSWLGEQRNWDVRNNDVPEHDPMYSPVNDPAYWSEYTDSFVRWPVNVHDNQFHNMRIDWNTEPAKIMFHVDGVHIHTITQHVPTIPMKIWVGIWFPSANTKWAGAKANWQTQDFQMSQFRYTPHTGAPFALKTESYPDVGIRPLTIRHFEEFI